MSGRGNNKGESLGKPRAGHYVFAHQAVRQICADEPRRFFGLMASDEQKPYVQFMIDQVAKHTPENPPDFSATDIQVTLTRIERYPMIVFTMPSPTAFTECVYIAIVSMVDGSGSEDCPSPEIKYFTLELGEAEGGGQTRFFCQWQDGDHLNIGEMDNESNIADFALAIRQRLISA